MSKTLDEILGEIPSLEPESISYEDIESYLGDLILSSIRVSHQLYLWACERYMTGEIDTKTKSCYKKEYSLSYDEQSSYEFPRPLTLDMEGKLKLSWGTSNWFREFMYLEPLPWCPDLYVRVQKSLYDATLYEVHFRNSEQLSFRDDILRDTYHNERFPALLTMKDRKIEGVAYCLEGKQVSFWNVYDKATPQDKKVLIRDWLPL